MNVETVFNIAWCCQPHRMRHGQHFNLKWIWIDGCDISDHLYNFMILGNNRNESKEYRPYFRIFGEKIKSCSKETLEKANRDKCYQSKKCGWRP